MLPLRARRHAATAALVKNLGALQVTAYWLQWHAQLIPSGASWPKAIIEFTNPTTMYHALRIEQKSADEILVAIERFCTRMIATDTATSLLVRTRPASRPHFHADATKA